MIDCPATKEQPEVLAAIQGEFDLEPMEAVFSYLKQQGTPDIPVPVNKEFHWAGIDWIINRDNYRWLVGTKPEMDSIVMTVTQLLEKPHDDITVQVI